MTVKEAKQIGDKPAAAPQGKSGSQPGRIDAATIRELAELLTETSLTEIEVEQNGWRVRVCRQTSQVYAPSPFAMPAPQAGSPAPTSVEAPKRDGHAPGTVTSPMVGTVYVAGSPGDQPFVKLGDTVSEGDTLLIVEAMKTMNPILAPRGGTVKEICIQDAEPVEFGQALIVLG